MIAGGQSGSGIPRECRYQPTSGEMFSRASVARLGGRLALAGACERVAFVAKAALALFPSPGQYGREQPKHAALL
ncbi:hypothetical protein DV26_08540 [Amycolatopsis mediterranei]|uniref:Uncharacterized protein n=1 Tax=Amycolatopsis mediterranei (strain S699) TaxID=713604 RepID=A0A9R0UB81_AMYMS|nr:hypothetical protein RAM_29850 [Amycolatopsis mediterranei S699]KDO11265.1 hypothetical protein DV26_08540 [Amycolatopsis mediterranei]KDU84975.1 hypothetical protein DV36_47915 [Amycolatopsis mediterranei]